MRTVAMIAVFVLVAGMFCGCGKTGSQTAKPASAKAAQWPADACAPLTEEDLVGFIKVLPAFSAALKDAKWVPAQTKEGDSPTAGLTSFVESMNVEGVDAALKKAGSSWSTLKPILYKVFAATAALSVDAAAPMMEQAKSDTSAVVKKNLEQFNQFKAACSQIPDANKQLLNKHQQELQALQSLGR